MPRRERDRELARRRKRREKRKKLRAKGRLGVPEGTVRENEKKKQEKPEAGEKPTKETAESSPPEGLT